MGPVSGAEATIQTRAASVNGRTEVSVRATLWRDTKRRSRPCIGASEAHNTGEVVDAALTSRATTAERIHSAGRRLAVVERGPVPDAYTC